MQDTTLHTILSNVYQLVVASPMTEVPMVAVALLRKGDRVEQQGKRMVVLVMET
jgi:hypothetical protein